MSDNNKQQFLETSRGGNITCPACGNPMSMREFASYQLVFTSKARQALNTMVDHFVNYLTFFDDALLFHDQYGLDSVPMEVVPYRVSDDMNKLGFFTSTYSEGIKLICRSQESLAVLVKIRSLPKTQDSIEESDHQELLDKCYSLLYGQLAPYDYVASLFEIVDQQYNIQRVIQGREKITPENFEPLRASLIAPAGEKGRAKPFNTTTLKSDLGRWERLVENLRAIAPGYARYIGLLLKLAIWAEAVPQPPAQPPAAASIFGQSTPPAAASAAAPRPVVTSEQIATAVMKFAHVLNVFLCGGYIEHEERSGAADGADAPRGAAHNGTSKSRYIRPYRFGLNSVVQDWDTLGRFITSYPALKMFETYWPESFVKRVRSPEPPDGQFAQTVKSLLGDPEPGSPSSVPQVTSLLEEIGRHEFLGVVGSVVDFACRGKAMTLPDYDVLTKIYGGTQRNLREMARDWIVSSICGWCPSERNAHSLVLLGGTGSGKSSIAQSGLVALSDSLSQFGYSLSLPGPVDKVVFDFFHNQHYKGQMPKATEEGARYTLTLSLQPINDSRSRVDLVFTDVAGEKMEAALLGGAEDPVVLGALKSAKTFVYLFDFLAWQTFASTLSSTALQEPWKDFVAQKKRLETESRAVRDSFEMLKAVVDKIYEIRKQEGAADPYGLAYECDFIVAFPKSDLYWNSNRYLSGFFENLKQSGIVRESLSSGTGKFVSRGVTPDAVRLMSGDGGGESDGVINPGRVLEIAKKVSDFAKQSLIQDFSQVFTVPGTNVEYVERLSLPTVLERGIIEFLERRFRRVFFFPVSAQGEEQEPEAKDGNEGVSLKSPAAQSLCEFIFLVAAASAMKSLTPEPDAATTTPGRGGVMPNL